MSEHGWPVGAATGIGSMPGTDVEETAAVVIGELPEFAHVPELPERGLGADPIGRTAGLLVDLPVDEVPTGYRVTARPGRVHRRAVDLLHWDMDGLQDAVTKAGSSPPYLKAQLTGPWTLAANVELGTGHRVLTDRGALREFAQSLVEGAKSHAAELAKRTGARVVIQLDEPSLPDVLAGALPTASGYGTVPSVPEQEAVTLLASVVEPLREATSAPVVVRCSATRPPVGVLHRAGAGAIAVDATLLDGAPGNVLDAVGEAWDAGTVFLLGLVPATEPDRAPPALHDLAGPALRLADRLGFARSWLHERANPTPTSGLGGASVPWARRALALTRDLGRAFAEPPESW